MSISTITLRPFRPDPIGKGRHIRVSIMLTCRKSQASHGAVGCELHVVEIQSSCYALSSDNRDGSGGGGPVAGSSASRRVVEKQRRMRRLHLEA